MTIENLFKDEAKERLGIEDWVWLGAVLHTGTFDLGIRRSSYVSKKGKRDYISAYPYVRIRTQREGLKRGLNRFVDNCSDNEGEFVVNKEKLWRLLAFGGVFCPAKSLARKAILGYLAIDDGDVQRQYLESLDGVDLRRDASKLEDYEVIFQRHPEAFAAGIIEGLGREEKGMLVVESTCHNLLVATSEVYSGKVSDYRHVGDRIRVRGKEYEVKQDSWIWTLRVGESRELKARLEKHFRLDK